MTDTIILAGNPNVGKSTLFNRLTGLRQHTGNWSGKTVGSAYGFLELGDRRKTVIDTPGTYSLVPSSPDEVLAESTICDTDCDMIIVVCDGSCLQRSLYLALQIMERRSNVVLCVNLIDEAEKMEIHIDFDTLSRELSVPVIGISAAKDESLDYFLDFIENLNLTDSEKSEQASDTLTLKNKAEKIYKSAVKIKKTQKFVHKLDKILTHKVWAWPIMLGLLFAILWLSISGANYPSELLSRFFNFIGTHIQAFLKYICLPNFIVAMLVDGIYGTTAWVVSVMLPPMAIFFPLFTLLEDLGLLPRIAFNLDGAFKKCGSCGKQALTMCMGLGCNAVGVTGCRIIGSPGEKLISILTNSFMPCNGRFPTIILLASLLFRGNGSAFAALIVLAMIVMGTVLTLISSKILSLTLCKGQSTTFALELPPYRKPKVAETLVRSLIDRSAKVLLRAIKAAAPAGLIIWLLVNIDINGLSILGYMQRVLDAPGKVFGLDGAIVLGFILGLPANEIVLPIIMLCYLSGSSLAALPAIHELSNILAAQGWTAATVLCLTVFTLLHWPCATTLMTIKKECGKMRWALLAALLPTVWGLIICFLINTISSI